MSDAPKRNADEMYAQKSSKLVIDLDEGKQKCHLNILVFRVWTSVS